MATRRLYVKVEGDSDHGTVLRLNPATGALLGSRALGREGTAYSYGWGDLLVDHLNHDRWVTKAGNYGDTSSIIRGYLTPGPGVHAPTPIIEVIPGNPAFNANDDVATLYDFGPGSNYGQLMLRIMEATGIGDSPFYAELVRHDGTAGAAVELFDESAWNKGHHTAIAPNKHTIHIRIGDVIHHWGWTPSDSLAPGSDFPLTGLGFTPVWAASYHAFGVSEDAYYIFGSHSAGLWLNKVSRLSGTLLWSIPTLAPGTVIVRPDGMIAARLMLTGGDSTMCLVSPIDGAITGQVALTPYGNPFGDVDLTFGEDLECYMVTATHAVRINAACTQVNWVHEFEGGEGRAVACWFQPTHGGHCGCRDCCPPGPPMQDFFSCPPLPVEPEPAPPPEDDDEDDGEDDPPFIM